MVQRRFLARFWLLKLAFLFSQLSVSQLSSLAISEVVAADERGATPPTSIRLQPGFEVDLLASAQADQGSWISLTCDAAGRWIVGLDDRGLARVTVSPVNSASTFEHLRHTESLRHCRGVLMTNDGLYVSATDSQALYVLRDLDGDDQFESLQELASIPYDSRFGHGANQLIQGPDRAIYLVGGNDVQFPTPTDPGSPYRNPQNDWLLPSSHDQGHDDRVGYIARLDPATQQWTILAGGLRNPFDMAFNRDGEMFTWDADMEWDVGLPWYRPTRLNHVVAGGEFGWRWGTGKWPEWFPDSLPATLDTGYSSPTGLCFGYASHWPERYRESLYMADWQLGRILLVDFVPRGSSYAADSQLFVEGAPLNVCDLQFGPDGDLYFITGGRGSQSGLYRVRWTGDQSESLTATPEPQPNEQHTGPGVADAASFLPAIAAVELDEQQSAIASGLRQTRRALERLHHEVDRSQLDFIWKQLSADDRWLRFAARVALENQPLDDWRDRMSHANDPRADHTACLALARVGSAADQRLVRESLAKVAWEELSPAEIVYPLRALQVSLARHGELEPEEKLVWRTRLERLFPQPAFPPNWLLSELLVRFDSRPAIAGCLELMETSSTQEEQIQFAKTVLQSTIPWEVDTAGRVVRWLAASRRFSGGKLVATTLERLQSDFLERFPPTVCDALRDELDRLHGEVEGGDGENLEALAPVQKFVREWKLAELIDEVVAADPQQNAGDREGLAALAAASCLKCHRFGDRGSPIGPDLTHVGKRFDSRALLESIVEPSRQIDPKYVASAYLMQDGRVVSGRALSVSRDQLVIETNAMTGASETILRVDIEQSRQSPISPMPSGLLDTLNREQIVALIKRLRQGPD